MLIHDPSFKKLMDNFVWAFPPNPLRHGSMTAYNIGTQAKDSVTIKSGVDLRMIEAHLNQTDHVGRLGYLPGASSTTTVGCLDIDKRKFGSQYDQVVAEVRSYLGRNNLTYAIEVSTNGGAHIWIWTESVDYQQMRDFLRYILMECGHSDVEYYPMGNKDAHGKWVYMPYSGAGKEYRELGLTYLIDPQGTPIPLSGLRNKIESMGVTSSDLVDVMAQRFREATAKKASSPQRKRLEDLHPANIRMLSEMVLLPPRKFERHKAMMVFLNLARRSSKLPEMVELLKSQPVYEAWISDGSRTIKGWAEELDRWAEPMYEADEFGAEYGIPELKGLGWKVGNLVKLGEEGDPTELQSLTAGEIAELYAQKLDEEDVRFLLLPNLDKWYTYHEGVYLERNQEYFLKDIETWCRSCGFYISESKLREVFVKLGRMHGMPDEGFEENPDFVNFSNGLYNWRTGEFIEHNPDIIQLTINDSVFDEQYRGKTEGKWTRFLDSVFQDESPVNRHRYTTALQMFLGYCLTSETRVQLMLNLHGKPGAGKGTIWRIFSGIMSSSRFSSANMVLDGFTFEELGNPHSLELLMHKRVVSVGEIVAYGQRARSAIVTLKSIVGEDAVTINPKNRKPYAQRLSSKFVIMSNNYISLGEDSNNDSVVRRLLLIPFNRTVPEAERDQRLEDKILNDPIERSKVVMWLIEGLEKLRNNNWKIEDTLRDQVAELKSEANPVIEFLSQYAELGDRDEIVSMKDLTLRYNVWAEEERAPTVNKRTAKNKINHALDSIPWASEVERIQHGKGSILFRRLRLTYVPGQQFIMED